MIKFSIITVCLNAGNDLLETVESTLKQSYSEFEIIVKDGFSKDESICKLPPVSYTHLVGLDFKILFKTVMSVLKKEGSM